MTWSRAARAGGRQDSGRGTGKLPAEEWDGGNTGGPATLYWGAGANRIKLAVSGQQSALSLNRGMIEFSLLADG